MRMKSLIAPVAALLVSLAFTLAACSPPGGAPVESNAASEAAAPSEAPSVAPSRSAAPQQSDYDY